MKVKFPCANIVKESENHSITVLRATKMAPTITRSKPRGTALMMYDYTTTWMSTCYAENISIKNVYRCSGVWEPQVHMVRHDWTRHAYLHQNHPQRVCYNEVPGGESSTGFSLTSKHRDTLPSFKTYCVLSHGMKAPMRRVRRLSKKMIGKDDRQKWQI